ncbi:MAG: hypothetical protein QNJ17_15405, partial [Desulfocapsaceae bacterium]|nr:hypothetical protein [Desulfocapsaceae bacterium]
SATSVKDHFSKQEEIINYFPNPGQQNIFAIILTILTATGRLSGLRNVIKVGYSRLDSHVTHIGCALNSSIIE